MTVFKFRSLIIAAIGLALVGLALELWFVPLEDAGDDDALSTLLAGMGLLLIIAGIALTFGLYFFRWWAPPAALAATVVGVALLVFTDTSAMPGIVTAFYDLSNILSGAVLACAFWSTPIAERFARSR